MKHRIAGMAICFVILFMIIAPICNAFDGTAIVAYRSNVLPTGKDVGHVGVGYQNTDGTWTCGAIEGPGGFQPNILYPDIVDPGKFNGAWVLTLNTLEQVEQEFAANKKAHAAYDSIKIIKSIKDANPTNAKIVIDDFKNRGFNGRYFNCLTGTNDVLKAYGDKYLPSAFDTLVGIPPISTEASTTPISYFSQLAGITVDLHGISMATSGNALSSQGNGLSDIYQGWGSISAWISAWIGMIQNKLPPTPERLLYTVGTVVVLLIGISLIWRSFRGFIINGVSGLVILYLSSTYLGIGVTVTALTLLVCAIGGIPGAILLVVLKYFYGISL